MADAQAKVRMVFATQDAIRKFQRWATAAQMGMNKIQKSTKDQKKESEGVSDRMDRWTGAIGKATLAMGGFLAAARMGQTVIGLVRKEFDLIVQRTKNAADLQRPFAVALREAVDFIPEGGEKVDLTEDYLVQLASQGSVPGVDAVRAFRAAMSTTAGGAAEKKRGVDVAAEVMRLRPDLAEDPEQMDAVIASIIGRQRVFGGTVRQQLAALIEGANQAQTKDFQKFAENLGRQSVGLAAYGFTMQEADALLGGAGTAAFDVQGATTATNVTKAVAQAYQKLKVRGRGDIEGLDMFRFINETLEGMTDSDRELAKELRGEFLGIFEKGLSKEDLKMYQEVKQKRVVRGDLNARERFRVFLQDLFQKERRQGDAWEIVEATLSGLPDTFEEAESRYLDRERKQAGSRHNALLKARYSLQRAKNQILLDPDLAGKGLIQQFITDIFETTGQGQLGAYMDTKAISTLKGIKDSMGGRTVAQDIGFAAGFTDQQIRLAQQRRRDLLDPTMRQMWMPEDWATRQRAAKEQERLIDALTGMRDALDSLRGGLQDAGHGTFRDAPRAATQSPQADPPGQPIQEAAAAVVGPQQRFQATRFWDSRWNIDF